jgi:hypothetical protein
LGLAAVAITLTVTVTASAFARAGGRSADQTYPVASALCAKAKAATLPAKLASHVAAVSTACDTLENAFGSLVSMVDAAEATLLSTVSVQKVLVASVCPKSVGTRTACATARATATSTDMAARTTEQAAVAAYHTGIDANRMTFWSTGSALR